MDDGDMIKIVPIPDDPVRALKGIARGEHPVEELMKYRRKERAHER